MHRLKIVKGGNPARFMGQTTDKSVSQSRLRRDALNALESHMLIRLISYSGSIACCDYPIKASAFS